MKKDACDRSGKSYTRETHLTPLEAAKAADCECWIPSGDSRPSSEKRYILLLQATDDTNSAQVGFPYEGGIEYRNFEPTPETQGLMEGLAGLIIRRPLELAQVLIEFERRRVEILRDIDRRHAEEDASDV